MTPLIIDIGIWYSCRVGDYGVGNGDFEAPAVQEALKAFVTAGLLIPAPPEQCTPRYYATPGMRAWVDALCRVRFPVQKWVMP